MSEGEEEDLAEEEEEDAKGVKSTLPVSMLAKKLEEKSRKQSRHLTELHGTGKIRMCLYDEPKSCYFSNMEMCLFYKTLLEGSIAQLVL